MATLTFNDEAEQYLVAILLRLGTSPAKGGAFGLLRPLLRLRRRALAGRGLRPIEVQRPHGARLREDPLCGPELVAPPPRDHQSRSGPVPWAGSQLQPALRGDEAPREARRCLCRLLSAWGLGEPAQGIAPQDGAGPHELLALLGESISRASDGRGVWAAAGIAATVPWYGLRHGTSLYLVGAAAQEGSMGGTLGAQHRTAPVPHGDLRHNLEPGSCGRGGSTRLTTRPGPCRAMTQREQSGDACHESPAQVVR